MSDPLPVRCFVAGPNDKTALKPGEVSGSDNKNADPEHLSRNANSLLDKGHQNKPVQLHGHIEVTSPYLTNLQIIGGSSKEHIIKKGENLTRIAKEALGAGASQKEIDRAIKAIVGENKLTNPDLILPGHSLRLPDAVFDKQRKPGTAPTEAPQQVVPGKNGSPDSGDGGRDPAPKTGPEKNQPDSGKPDRDKPDADKPKADRPNADRPEDKPTDKPVSPTVKAEVAKLDAGAVDKAAKEIHDAAFNRNLWGVGWSSPDAKPIKTILGSMNEADRAAVEKRYGERFHSGMRGDLDQQFSGDSVGKSEIGALMMRKDGKSDEAGQIHTALAKLGNVGRTYSGDSDSDSARAEGQLRNAISTMTARQIEELKQTYQKNYGQSLESAISGDNVSPESQKALGIYLKGIEKRTPADTAALADAGVASQRLDLFQESMQYATPEARKAFIDNGGEKKIADAFSGGDARIAGDYARNGFVSLATLVDGDSHWYHTNKEEISRAIDNCQPEERAKFQAGKELADNKTAPQTDEQREALKFYQSMEKVLGSAGNDRQSQIWQAKLNDSESVVAKLLESHKDGFLGIGSGHEKNDVYGAVENLSRDDWQRLKANPAHLQDVENALKTISDDQERGRLMGMLADKLSAPTYEASLNTGRRAISEALTDAGDDSRKQVDALSHMSAPEKEQYYLNSNGFATNLNKQVEGLATSDGAKFVNADLLRQLKEGKEPELSPLDKVALQSTKTDNGLTSVADMEAAFKADSTLLGRIKNPQTDEDKKLKSIFEGALNNAVDKAGLGAQSYGEGGEIPSQYPDFAKTLLQTGHLPIDQKMQMTNGDNTAVIGVLQTASAEEKAALLTVNPDEKTKQLQTSVLGGDPQRSLLENVLKQGKLTEADQLRAFAIGYGGDSSAQLQMLSRMTPEAKQNLANEYFTKYGSLASQDVVEKAKESERFRFVELLSPTDLNVRQIALDSRVENDSHTSIADGVMRGAWDYTAVAAQDNSRQLERFVAQHAAELEKLPPEQRQKFDEAVTNYIKAQQSYVDSKGAASELVVDAAITVVAVGGAAFSGGSSLALMGIVGGGAVARVGAMKALEGSDFDSSTKNVLEQGFKGAATAALSVIGPELLGVKGLVAVGDGVATRTAAAVLERAAAQGLEATAFRGGESAAQTIISDGLSTLTRRGAIIGEKSTENSIKEIAAKALGETATAEQKAALETTIKQELRSQVTKTLRDKVMNEAESAALNIATASGANATSELASTAVGLSDPKTLFERMGQSALAGAAGAAFFHVAFRTAAVGYHGTQAILGRDQAGIFAGEGTKVLHADGTESTVQKDTKYRFREGDKVVEREPNNTPPENENGPKVPEKGQQQLPEKIPEKTPEKAPDKAPEKAPEKVEAKSTSGSETPNRFRKTWTDLEGKEWSRDSYSDKVWKSADGSTYTRDLEKQVWAHPDGSRKAVFKNGGEMTYDPKTARWTDNHGTVITQLSDHTIYQMKDGSRIEQFKNGVRLTHQGENVEINFANQKITKLEMNRLDKGAVDSITMPEGKKFVRHGNEYVEDVAPGTNRKPDVIKGLYRLENDGRLKLDDGVTETTFRPDGKIERHNSANIFEVHASGVSDAFRERADLALLGLAPEVRELLARKNIKVLIGKSIPDVDPTMKGVEPRGHGPGRTWDMVEGFYSPNEKRAVLTENFYDQNGQLQPTTRADGVLRHELGHAVDDALGTFSSTKEFKSSYKLDRDNIVKHFTPAEQERLEYFMQEDGPSKDQRAGRSEALAELFGVLNGGGSAYHDEQLIRRAFPETIKIIEARMAKLKATGN